MNLPDYSKALSGNTIKQKLHYFNLTNDWSIFWDVPEVQHVSIMYPSVTRAFGSTEEQYRESLVELFGPLDEHHQKLFNDWRNACSTR